MNVKPFALAGVGAFALAGTASAALVGETIRNSPVQHPDPDVTTYRLYLIFDNQLDEILAVSGNEDVSALVFQSTVDLAQNCALPNSILCDSPKGLDLGGDSWVTLGGDMPGNGGADVSFSPGFLGGDGVQSVIKGNFFSQSDNGGYFDSDPGSPVVPNADGEVLIAQFSLDTGGGEFLDVASYIGTVDYVPGGADGFVSEAFAFVPTPGALALLGLAGLAGTRRRRQ